MVVKDADSVAPGHHTPVSPSHRPICVSSLTRQRLVPDTWVQESSRAKQRRSGLELAQPRPLNRTSLGSDTQPVGSSLAASDASLETDGTPCHRPVTQATKSIQPQTPKRHPESWLHMNIFVAATEISQPQHANPSRRLPRVGAPDVDDRFGSPD